MRISYVVGRPNETLGAELHRRWNKERMMYQKSKERDRVLTRRLFLLMAGKAAAGPVPAQAKFGDDEWMRRFKQFVKAFNDFVIALNDGRLDRGKWEQMRTEWQRLEVG